MVYVNMRCILGLFYKLKKVSVLWDLFEDIYNESYNNNKTKLFFANLEIFVELKPL